ncbi:MAG: imidazole glycerol phosphate synthase subunit HisH [Acidobacteria bacterium]|nr:imidazole glycerol phosphate synthase subunit HisH [Acidobacteriota bacterium]
MIAVVDYGVGNVTSVMKAFKHLGADAVVTSVPDVIERADKIVLPGVGHFSATAALDESGMKNAISRAISRGVPFLGICVGMQWMLESSEEAPGVRGLGLFSGTCERFPASVKSPHVGWNSLCPRRDFRLFYGVAPGAFVYFTHSYRVPVSGATSAECEYGGVFSAAIERDRVFGVQFHPEKSGAAGLQVLENFCALPC